MGERLKRGDTVEWAEIDDGRWSEDLLRHAAMLAFQRAERAHGVKLSEPSFARVNQDGRTFLCAHATVMEVSANG